MKRKHLIIIAVFVLLAALLPSAVIASPGANDGPDLAGKTDFRVDPLTAKQLELKERALAAQLNGKSPFAPVKEVAKGQFVELERQGEDPVWTEIGRAHV